MAKKKWKKAKKTTNIIVYVLSITIGGIVHHKVGVTSRSAKVRMLEIAGELYDILGYVPLMKIMKQQSCKNSYKVEAAILKETLEHQLPSDSLIGDFTGRSEIRLLSWMELEACYDRCINADYPANVKEQHWLVDTGGYNGL